ncbi:hypothetical protein DFH06DRAFT_1174542 [Mycena polygramma]|nr:hypothetical protein DFH06DRAFT_1174542 [Mycena polygramma]
MPPTGLVPQIFATYLLYVCAFFARTLAFSRTFNTRNLEAYWYIVWNHTLIALVDGLPNHLVAPQYHIWCVEAEHPTDEEPGNDAEEDQVEDMANDESEDVEREDAPLPARARTSIELADIAEYDEAADRSSDSLGTIAQGKATTQITDFAIVEVITPLGTDTSLRSTLGQVFTALVQGQGLGLPTPMKNFLATRRVRMALAMQSPRVLVEIKRSTHRNAVGEAFAKGLNVLLSEAQIQLLEQAAVLFCMEEATAEVVILIAAAGPWYTTAHVRRGSEIDLEALQEAIDDKKVGVMAMLSVVPVKPRWTKPRYLGTTLSNQRLLTVRRHLEGWNAFAETV